MQVARSTCSCTRTTTATFEITIAGHADSLTCGATSERSPGALIDARDGPENFVIAGAGRMSVPLIDENRRTALLETVEVTEYKSSTRR